MQISDITKTEAFEKITWTKKSWASVPGKERMYFTFDVDSVKYWQTKKKASWHLTTFWDISAQKPVVKVEKICGKAEVPEGLAEYLSEIMTKESQEKVQEKSSLYLSFADGGNFEGDFGEGLSAPYYTKEA